jgi:ribosomal protein S27E
MDSLYSSCRVTCHNCGHEWIYMGIRLRSLHHPNPFVRVQCPRCHVNRVKMYAKDAV